MGGPELGCEGILTARQCILLVGRCNDLGIRRLRKEGIPAAEQRELGACRPEGLGDQWVWVVGTPGQACREDAVQWAAWEGCLLGPGSSQVDVPGESRPVVMGGCRVSDCPSFDP